MSRQSRIVVLLLVAIAVASVIIARPATPPAGPTSGVTDAPLKQAAASTPRILCLGAGKCIPCKAMEPVRESLRTEYAGRLDVKFCDIWKEPSCAEKHDVSVIPTTIFYDAAGREIDRTEGYLSKDDILARFAQAGVSF